MSVELENLIRRANIVVSDKQLDQIFGEHASRHLLDDIHAKREGRMTENQHTKPATEQRPLIGVPQDTDDVQATTVPSRRRQPLAVALAAVVAVILVGTVAWWTSARVADEEVATTDDRLAVADMYFAAYEAADVDAVRPLFAPDASFSTPLNSGGLDALLEDFAQFAAWDAAQGTEISERTCTPDQGGAGVAVTCVYDSQQYLRGAVGTRALTRRVTMEFDAEGNIATLTETYDPGRYEAVDVPFNDWMETNHPTDAAAVACCGWTTVEEAAANGALRASYADEWVVFAQSVIDETFRIHNQGDLEGFLGHFVEGTTVLDAAWANAPVIIGALMAVDSTYTLSECRPFFADNWGLWIECDASATHRILAAGGYELTGTVSMTVNPDGLISSMSTSMPSGINDAFTRDFKQWLLENHPDVDDAIRWTIFDLAEPDDMATVVEYVEIFVAQSDEYPIDEGANSGSS